MAENTLSEYDQDFAHAMALKLRLNREARSRRADLIERHGEAAIPLTPSIIGLVRNTRSAASTYNIHTSMKMNFNLTQ